MRKARVAIVDDHPVVRRGISVTFAEQDDFEVVAEGVSADDAVRIAASAKPDLMVLDVTMPGGGVEATERILKAPGDIRVLILSVREEIGVVRAALHAGASGYISKGVEGPDLVTAARRVLAGERYVSSSLAAQLLAAHDLGDAQPPRGQDASQDTLTERERQIFELLGKGQSNLEIAEKIGLRENTVKHYMTQLLQKLGVRNRTEAALLARGRPGAKSR